MPSDGLTVDIVHRLMTLAEYEPDIDAPSAYLLQEIFQSDLYRNAGPEEQRRIKLLTATARCDDERDFPWDQYFETDLKPYLAGKDVLDLGCFNGGRSVVWSERYGFRSLAGIDISHEGIDAANLLADKVGLKADFRLSTGESLPYPDATFDAVVTFDVLEHVQSVAETMGECFRVLRPGGHMVLCFPPFFHPTEHHLGLATRLPAIHWFFPRQAVFRAYMRILEGRGAKAAWYRRTQPLQSWERCATINGTTLAAFNRIVAQQGWEVKHQSRRPLLSIGRAVRRSPVLRFLSSLLRPLTFIPGVNEFVLHRIAFVLKKPA